MLLRYFWIYVMMMHGLVMAQHSFDSSDIGKPVLELVVSIEQENVLMGGAVGYAGIRPEQYNLFIELQNTASTDELVNLTNHPNGVVRAYAFWALTLKDYDSLFDIVLDHIGDEQDIATMFGCIISEMKVGDFFIKVVTPDYIDLNSKKLNLQEIQKLDSILIFTPNNLHSTSSAINNAGVNESYYPPIRALASNLNQHDAIIALAKFQKESDVDLFLKYGEHIRNTTKDYYHFYKAISWFPHPIFFSSLRENQRLSLKQKRWSTEWRALYDAIAGYKNEDALALLYKPFTEVKKNDMRKYHIDFLFGAVQKYKSELYDELLIKLWREENRIDPDILVYLFDKYPDVSYDLIKQSIKNSKTINRLNANYSMEELFNIMFSKIKQEESDLILELIKENIKNADVHMFPIFANQAIKLKHTSFVKPLVSRLRKESNPHVYIKITEVLISYNDEAINKEITEAREVNKKLRNGWGGESFSNLLIENNIK